MTNQTYLLLSEQINDLSSCHTFVEGEMSMRARLALDSLSLDLLGNTFSSFIATFTAVDVITGWPTLKN